MHYVYLQVEFSHFIHNLSNVTDSILCQTVSGSRYTSSQEFTSGWSLAKVWQRPNWVSDTPGSPERFVDYEEKIKMESCWGGSLFFGELLKLEEKTDDDSINKNERSHLKHHHNGDDSGRTGSSGRSISFPLALDRVTRNSKQGLYLQGQDYIFWLWKSRQPLPLGRPPATGQGRVSVFLLRKLRRPHACYVCLSRVCVTLRYVIYFLNS